MSKSDQNEKKCCAAKRLNRDDVMKICRSEGWVVVKTLKVSDWSLNWIRSIILRQ